MKILVTGGAGYIGSVTVEELIAKGHEVIVVDNLSQGHKQAVNRNAEFVVGDIADPETLERLFHAHPGIEAVMHFASRTLVGESMRRPELYIRDNMVMAVNVIDTAVRHGAGRFILSSTANLFDDPGKIPIDEKASIHPGSPYGESKYMIERTLNWYERIHRLRYCSLRYFNAAGATERLGEDHNPETHIIPLLLEAASGRNGGFTVFGDDYPTPDGTCIRDYIHIQDLADAHILAIRALDESSRIYNLGNSRGYSIREVIATAEKVSGRSIPWTMGPRRPGDPPELVASSVKIRKELGWEPKLSSLESIISTAWEWHLRHPSGYVK